MDSTPENHRPDMQVTTRRSNGQFAPGHSGNPEGRPRMGSSWAEVMRTALEMEAGGEDGIAVKEKIVQVLIDRAVNGDLRAIEIIFDRTEGKPRQMLEVSSNDWPVLQGLPYP